ncbi:uncharacterized protein A4U43_C09F9060, partial [Asparagus officinalis]
MSNPLPHSSAAAAFAASATKSSLKNNVRCVSAAAFSPFETLRLRRIQHRGVEAVKACKSGFTPSSGEDKVLDGILECLEVETNTNSPGTSFFAKIAIALGIAATVILISIFAKWSPSGSSHSLPLFFDSSSQSVPVTSPVGFNLKIFGYNIIIPEYTPG